MNVSLLVRFLFLESDVEPYQPAITGCEKTVLRSTVRAISSRGVSLTDELPAVTWPNVSIVNHFGKTTKTPLTTEDGPFTATE